MQQHPISPSLPSHLQAVLFDMDGVLFDSMPYHARCWHEAMQHFGLHLPEQEAYLHEGRTGAGTVNIVSMRERGRPATEQEIHDIYTYKSQLFNRCPPAPPMPGALELLQKVKQSGLTPVLVTGSGQQTLLDCLQQAFPGIFRPEHMVTAFDVTHGKPHPEPYLKGLEKAGRLRPDQAVAVENAPLGVTAAVAAGLFTIAVNTGPLPDSALTGAGAGLLFPSVQALSDAWEELLAAGRTNTPLPQ